jgi:hypothetical protein
MASTYRRKKGSDTWHFCTNCTQWPTSDYTDQSTKPSGDLCNQCKSKRDNNNCN